VASEDNGVIDGYGNGGGVERDGATSIAKLAHGEQRGGGEVGNDVDVAGSGW
jgi:hypothetical protein